MLQTFTGRLTLRRRQKWAKSTEAFLVFTTRRLNSSLMSSPALVQLPSYTKFSVTSNGSSQRVSADTNSSQSCKSASDLKGAKYTLCLRTLIKCGLFSLSIVIVRQYHIIFKSGKFSDNLSTTPILLELFQNVTVDKVGEEWWNWATLPNATVEIEKW